MHNKWWLLLFGRRKACSFRAAFALEFCPNRANATCAVGEVNIPVSAFHAKALQKYISFHSSTSFPVLWKQKNSIWRKLGSFLKPSPVCKKHSKHSITIGNSKDRNLPKICCDHRERVSGLKPTPDCTVKSTARTSAGSAGFKEPDRCKQQETSPLVMLFHFVRGRYSTCQDTLLPALPACVECFLIL